MLVSVPPWGWDLGCLRMARSVHLGQVQAPIKGAAGAGLWPSGGGG